MFNTTSYKRNIIKQNNTFIKKNSNLAVIEWESKFSFKINRNEF